MLNNRRGFVERKKREDEEDNGAAFSYAVENAKNDQGKATSPTASTPTATTPTTDTNNSYQSAVDKILNGDASTFNLNGNALYNQYKDAYLKQGALAMEDTMGQASALTGGYGNSYAQMLGEQQYKSYLDEFNSAVVPELYNLAIGQASASNDEKFHQAIYRRQEDNGDVVWDINGKETTVSQGRNPYNGKVHKDTLTNGVWDKTKVFSNGYQPNNINGEPLSKTGEFVYVNGVKQNVWQTPDGAKWVWDGTINDYEAYDKIKFE